MKSKVLNLDEKYSLGVRANSFKHISTKKNDINTKSETTGNIKEKNLNVLKVNQFFTLPLGIHDVLAWILKHKEISTEYCRFRRLANTRRMSCFVLCFNSRCYCIFLTLNKYIIINIIVWLMRFLPTYSEIFRSINLTTDLMLPKF